MSRRLAIPALLAALGHIAIFSTAYAQDQEVLPAQQAFPYSIEATPDRLLLNFAVLDGYYLYRERFGFDATDGAVSLGTAQFPRGEVHEDEFFGRQEIYRGEFRVAIPYRRTGAATIATTRQSLRRSTGRKW
jgi:thiol:disulfide interchange protein DsbD